jgi:hypothetical protein
MEDIHNWIEPLSQLVNDVLSLNLDLLSKESDNGAWSIAGFEQDGQWMRKEICLCSSFVYLQGIIEN